MIDFSLSDWLKDVLDEGTWVGLINAWFLFKWSFSMPICIDTLNYGHNILIQQPTQQGSASYEPLLALPYYIRLL